MKNEPKTYTAIPVNEKAERKEDFTPEEVLLRAGFDNARQILNAFEEANYHLLNDSDFQELFSHATIDIIRSGAWMDS